MEKRGIRTERGDQNRAIAVSNQQIRELRARAKKIKEWVYAQPLQDVPTMVELMGAMNAAQNMKSQWQKVAHLQRAAKVLIFLQENHINGSMEKLADKIMEINQRIYDLGNDVKAKERRITTLSQHIANVDIFNQHKAIYKKYKSLDPKTDRAAQGSLNPFTRSKAAKEHEAAVKKQEAYYEKHAEEIAQYESASAYLKNHLNGYGKIPEKEWRAERENLLAERYAQVDNYYKLKDDIQNVETIKRGAMNLMRDITPERVPARAHSVEL